jgi:hypothetical protein
LEVQHIEIHKLMELLANGATEAQYFHTLIVE